MLCCHLWRSAAQDLHLHADRGIEFEGAALAGRSQQFAPPPHGAGAPTTSEVGGAILCHIAITDCWLTLRQHLCIVGYYTVKCVMPDKA